MHYPYLLTYSLTHSMQHSPSWEAPGSQLVKKFPAFYGTRRFITAFTSARQLSLSWASSIQSIPSHTICWRSILILSSHLRLGHPSGFFTSGFPTVYTSSLPHTRYMPRPSHSSTYIIIINIKTLSHKFSALHSLQVLIGVSACSAVKSAVSGHPTVHQIARFVNFSTAPWNRHLLQKLTFF